MRKNRKTWELVLEKPTKGASITEEEKENNKKKKRQIKIDFYFAKEELYIVAVYFGGIVHIYFIRLALEILSLLLFYLTGKYIEPFDVNKAIEYFSYLMLALIGAPLLKEIIEKIWKTK